MVRHHIVWWKIFFIGNRIHSAELYAYAHGYFEDILKLPCVAGRLALGELEANENFTSAHVAASCCKTFAV